MRTKGVMDPIMEMSRPRAGPGEVPPAPPPACLMMRPRPRHGPPKVDQMRVHEILPIVTRQRVGQVVVQWETP